MLRFCLIGDSNVKRNMTPTCCRDRPLHQAAQVVQCGRFEVFSQSLTSIKPEVTICVISCLTNFLTSSEDTSASVAHRVGPVLDDVFTKVAEECVSNPGRRYLVCPPMYRRTPLWYRDGLPEILNKFSSLYKNYAQPNLSLMPSFPSPELESDGVHLTPYSGLEFVLHLFDAAQHLIKVLEASPEAKQSEGAESTRLLEDRVVALEQDHKRLSSEFDLKMAIKAESDDVTINERFEDSFIISGLARITGRLGGKEWQDKAQEIVQKAIVSLMGGPMKISVVHNSTGPSPKAPVTYSVQMVRVEDAKAIRSKFGGFFRGGTDSRPESLSGVSIQNLVTRETRIRISIMKLLADRYRKSNPGGKAQVIGYLPRPMLKLTPPPESKNKRVMSYNYIEAVQKLPTNFERSEIQDITNRAAKSFPGRLRSLFIVLSDDLVVRAVRQKRAGSPSGHAPEPSRARVAEVEDEFAAEDV